jgi:hypothetical protein
MLGAAIMFHVHNNHVDIPDIVPDEWYKVILKSVVVDNMDGYNSTTGEYIIKATGYYVFGGKVSLINPSPGSVLDIRILRNGNGLSVERMSISHNRDQNVTVFAPYEYFEYGDKVVCEFRHRFTGGVRAIEGEPQDTKFWGRKVD